MSETDLHSPPERQSRRQRRAERLRAKTLSPGNILMRVLALPGLTIVVALSIYVRTSPYGPSDALMHLLARTGCDSARTVGLAPARRGELGYHDRNDPDGNGVACETAGTGAVQQVTSSAAPTQAPATPGRMMGGAKFIKP